MVPAGGDAAPAPLTAPVVFRRGSAAVETPVYRRATLGAGDRFDGPGHRRGTRDDRRHPSRVAAEVAPDGSIIATQGPACTSSDARLRPDRARDLWQSLIATVNEQARALQRAAFSPIVREAGDLANAVFDRRGRMVAQAVTGTPGHINSLAIGVVNILDEYPIESLEPGDIIDHERPYKTAGQLLDVTVLVPGLAATGRDHRVLRLDDPPHRRRRLRHRRRRARRVRGRPVDPDRQADEARRAQRRRVEVHPLERPPARPHGRRPARPDGLG